MRPDRTAEHIRKLRLTSRRLIQTFGEGTFRTMFHGRGIEFATLREYVPGDDIRQIEWNTTARRGSPFVKTFIEERDLSILLVVDLSSSMDIRNKTVMRLASLITSLADYHEDRIGCLGFTEKVEFFLPPLKSPIRPNQILHLLLTRPAGRQKTSVNQALGFLLRTLKKHTIVFILSDFLDKNFEKNFLALAQKNEIVGICVYDPAERNLPPGSVMDCFDPESGQRMYLDTYDAATRTEYQLFTKQHTGMMQRVFSKARADLLIMPDTEQSDFQLIDFLRRRQTSRIPLQWNA